jgi:transaldolase
MTNTKLHKLTELGQSIWLDYIWRSLIKSGDLAAYVQKGLRGMTSNPAIFEKAIAETDEYDDQIQSLALEGKTAQEIYEALAIDDIRSAADILRPVFDESEVLTATSVWKSTRISPMIARLPSMRHCVCSKAWTGRTS